MPDSDIIFTLLEPDLLKLPKRVKKFLKKGQAPSADEQTLSYFAYGYSAGFEELATEVIRWAPKRDYLCLPAYYLGRHSMELAIKAVVDYASEYSGLKVQQVHHSLLPLWNSLVKQCKALGHSADDEWSLYCLKLINHIHEHDPDGERFRYPTSKVGDPFPFTRGEFEGFVTAHSHITAYCDAICTALREERERA